MGGLYLTLAIVFEVAGTTSMKLTEGFSKPWWVAALVVAYGASLAFLTLSLRTVDLGTAYAIWSGLGTALVVVVGWLVFAGVAGMNLFGKVH